MGEQDGTAFVLEAEETRFVESLGLGSAEPGSAEPLIGRNESCVLRTTGGARVFLKRLTGTPDDSRARMARSTAFLESSAGMPAPVHLGTDPDRLLTAYEYVPDARSASELLDDRLLGPDTLATVASGLAALHDSTPLRPLDADDPRFPSPTLHDHLGLAELYSFSAAELAMWRIVHGDDALRAALADLSAATSAAERAPAHCDLRLDQILVREDTGAAVVTDWEEYRSGDPARDPGTLLGDLVFRALVDVASGVDSDVEADPDGAGDPFVTAGAAALARVAPLVDAFWRTYAAARATPLGPDFVARVSALAGWHLLDRVLAASKVKARLTATDRALAGIGRTILLRPAAAGEALGLAAGEGP